MFWEIVSYQKEIFEITINQRNYEVNMKHCACWKKVSPNPHAQLTVLFAWAIWQWVGYVEPCTKHRKLLNLCATALLCFPMRLMSFGNIDCNIYNCLSLPRHCFVTFIAKTMKTEHHPLSISQVIYQPLLCFIYHRLNRIRIVSVLPGYHSVNRYHICSAVRFD